MQNSSSEIRVDAHRGLRSKAVLSALQWRNLFLAAKLSSYHIHTKTHFYPPSLKRYSLKHPDVEDDGSAIKHLKLKKPFGSIANLNLSFSCDFHDFLLEVIARIALK